MQAQVHRTSSKGATCGSILQALLHFLISPNLLLSWWYQSITYSPNWIQTD